MLALASSQSQDNTSLFEVNAHARAHPTRMWPMCTRVRMSARMPRVAGLHVVREYLENVLPHFDTDCCGTCRASWPFAATRTQEPRPRAFTRIYPGASRILSP